MMNLAKQFREFGVLNSINPLPPDAQVVWYNLMQYFNTARWSARKLVIRTQALENTCGMTRKRLGNARNYLIQRGLIKYYPARQASGSPAYEMVVMYEDNDLSVFLTETPKGTQDDTQKGTQAGTQKATPIKTKLTKNENNLIAGVPPAVNPPPVKKAPKKAEAQINKTEHWQKMVDLWFTFYKERFLNDPTFNGIAAKNLKLVLKRLQKITEDGGKIWDEAMAIKVFNRFLTLAFADKWLQDNFILNNLYSKFDSIVNKKNGSHQQTTEKIGKSAGANQLLNELSAELTSGAGFGIQSDD